MTDWLCLKRLGEDRRTSVAAISSIFKPTTGSGFGRQPDKHGSLHNPYFAVVPSPAGSVTGSVIYVSQLDRCAIMFRGRKILRRAASAGVFLNGWTRNRTERTENTTITFLRA
jgi:hypothetical protein